MYKYKKEHKFCEICGKEKPLEVHHIKPLISGGMDSPENFIALCSECHKLVHEQDKGTLTNIPVLLDIAALLDGIIVGLVKSFCVKKSIASLCRCQLATHQKFISFN